MRTEWPIAAVESCMEYLTLGGTPKVLTRDYKSLGTYPIVDQGQNLIAGWTDDDSGLISTNLPVVVFGDHTRAFKYVDFPFVRGADGTQLLKPKSGIDPLFFYYACRAIDLPSRGYNRHFKLLKEKEIPTPQLQEQRGIARTLKRIDDALLLQDKQIQTVMDLKGAAMRTLFTSGLRRETQKKTEIGPVPESWERLPISSLGKIITGNTPPTKDSGNYVGGEVPFVTPGDIEHGFRIEKTEKFITDQGLKHSRPITMGTTCFVCIGSTIGKVGYATSSFCATNQQINSILPNDRFNPQFTFYLLTFWADHVRKHASRSPVPILSKSAFEQIELVTTTDLTEQQEIVAILDAIDRKIDLHRRKRAVLDDLFKALLHKLITGEIRASELALAGISPVRSPDEAQEYCDYR